MPPQLWHRSMKGHFHPVPSGLPLPFRPCTIPVPGRNFSGLSGSGKIDGFFKNSHTDAPPSEHNQQAVTMRNTERVEVKVMHVRPGVTHCLQQQAELRAPVALLFQRMVLGLRRNKGSKRVLSVCSRIGVCHRTCALEKHVSTVGACAVSHVMGHYVRVCTCARARVRLCMIMNVHGCTCARVAACVCMCAHVGMPL